MIRLATLSGSYQINEDAFKTLTISGFYGQGAWAAWLIILISSWIPMLRDDYTHNVHFIAYALYTNWAAMNYCQLFSLDRKLRDLESDVAKLVHQIHEAKIPLSLILNDLEDESSLCAFRKTAIEHYEGFSLSADLHSKTWQWYVAESGEQVFDDLPQDERKDQFRHQLGSHTEICRQIASLWTQSMAAKAVLRLGTLHACVQLWVGTWKIKGPGDNGAAERPQRRNLIIRLGLILPLVVWYTGHLRELHFSLPVWMAPTWGSTCILFSTTIGIWWSRANSHNFPGREGPMAMISSSLFLMIDGAAMISCCGDLIEVLSPTGPSRQCLLTPCTPVKASELDQAFGLFSAICLFLYEFVPLFFTHFKSFWPSLKRPSGLKQSWREA